MMDVQVHRLKEFELWSHYCPITYRLEMVNADDMPFFTYPDGRACYEANLYIAEKIRTGVSLLVKGGTARTYSYMIVHLIKFCCRQSLNFIDMNDDYFTLFTRGLMAERNGKNQLKRQNNRVIEIAHLCLDFLEFIGSFHDIPNFIGEEKENAIRIIIKEHRVYKEGMKNPRVTFTKTHESIPSKDPTRKKVAVSTTGTQKIWSKLADQSPYKCQRDSLIFQFLEQTGGRRTEVAFITIDDIERADRESIGDSTNLRMTTLKQKGKKKGKYRVIPVPQILIDEAKRYIRKVRKKVILNKGKKSGNSIKHRYLFISLTTAKPLQTDTITDLVSDWAEMAGLDESVHPHLFRHAYITNKLKEIILEHKEINSKDKFRELLLNTERFKMILQQWTGHTSTYSLDTYIDLVFNDLAGSRKAYKAVGLSAAVTMVEQGFERLSGELENKGITPTEFLARSKDLLSSFKLDIAASKS